MKKFDNINVIPFIDIMLVLLAIVLTTATFVTSGHLDIDLPPARTEASTADTETVEIAIDRDLQLYFSGAPVTLVELQEKLATVDDSNRIVLQVDQSVPFSHFVSVIDLLKSEAMDNVSIQTRRDNSIPVSKTPLRQTSESQ